MGWRTLQRRDHARDGVVEGGAAVKIGLPEFLQQLEAVVPATLIEPFPQGVGIVAAAGDTADFVPGSCAGRARHQADEFASGGKNQSWAQVVRGSLTSA